MSKLRLIITLSMVILVTFVLSACNSDSDNESTQQSNQSNEESLFWLQARSGNDDILGSIEEIAVEFQKDHPDFELEIDGTGDRPAYLQQLRTLIAGNKMPDMFDTDPDAFAKRLVENDDLVNIGEFLEEEELYDDFIPEALAYQQFDDGNIYTLPIEYNMEMFFYNKEIFEEYSLSPPTTFEELLTVSEELKENDVTPIAMGGVDKWPVLRYLAFIPFRETGNDFLNQLTSGEASMSDSVGLEAAEFVQEIGQYFQEGFSSTDYTTARQLFSSGQTAMYYMGSWETMNILNDGMNEENLDYFTLPMISSTEAATAQNEYFTHSGIGLAFNKNTFNETSEEFLKYLIERYPEIYSETGQFSPIAHDNENFKTSLHEKINKDMQSYGEDIAFPWDTRLDPASNEAFGNEIILLADGTISPEEFVNNMDQILQENIQN